MYFSFGLGSKCEMESHCWCFQKSSRDDVPDKTSHAVNVQVALLNGHAYELRSLLPSSSVRDLRMAAQEPLGKSTSELSQARSES